jgi:cytochrome c peroxidase
MVGRIGAGLVACGLSLGCSHNEAPLTEVLEDAPASVATLSDPIDPITPFTQLSPAKVALGARLFADPILSGDEKTACTTCHDLTLKLGGADGRAISAIAGRAAQPSYNTPTIFNVGLLYKLSWQGAFSSLEEIIPLTKPAVMNSTWDGVLQRLRARPAYANDFSALYPQGLNEAAVRDAIATYERSLTTPGSRFDKYLRGAADALSAEEKEGYSFFKNFGCISCHQGVGVGGNLVARFGVMRDPRERGPIKPGDRGLADPPISDAQREFYFRVPSLRNVARTAPYFHDGSAATLELAVAEMADYQLGRNLTATEVDRLVAFLGSLTGELPASVAP